MSGMLFVHAGAGYARRVFADDGRAYWATGFPAVLEKLGLLAVDVRGPDVLDEPDVWRRYDCVLLAELPADALRAEAVEALVTGGTPALVEGPLPRALHGPLGIERVRPAKPEISVSVRDPDLARAAGLPAHAPIGRLRGAHAKPAPREAPFDWQSLPVPVSDAQAAAWRTPGWRVEIASLREDVRVHAEWTRSVKGGAQPAVFSRGPLTACSFGLLSALAQHHTSEPARPGTWPSSGSVTGLEHLLLALVDRLHAQAGVARPRVLPWPDGRRWGLTVRHDFDRPLDTAQVSAVLRGHARAGTQATWYWRARHLRAARARLPHRLRGSWEGNDAAQLVARTPGHEVALHTEHLWRADHDERATVEAVIGRPVAGTSAHGDPRSFRFQGAPNVLWAERQGLLYTELIQHAHLFPHRFPALEATGEVRLLEVICLPHHVSFDRSTTPGAHLADQVLDSARRCIEAGALLQVMNHPDLHQSELFATLGALPRDGRLDLPAGGFARWWRRTHTFAELSMVATRDREVRLTSRRPVQGVQVELRLPDGARAVRATDLDAGRPATLAA